MRTVGYIPGKTARKTANAPVPPKPQGSLTPKQAAAAEARELGIEIPDDLSKITENKIRELLAAKKAELEAATTDDASTSSEAPTDGADAPDAAGDPLLAPAGEGE